MSNEKKRVERLRESVDRRSDSHQRLWTKRDWLEVAVEVLRSLRKRETDTGTDLRETHLELRH